MGILIPFKSGEPVEFTEPQVDGTLKAMICGRVDVTEYNASSGRESVIWNDDGTVLIERINSSNEEG